MSEGKSCIMFVCHELTAFTLRQLDSIRRSVNPTSYDIVVLFNGETPAEGPRTGFYYFNRDVVADHGFQMHSYYLDTKLDFYGNNFEYSFLCFFKDNPAYKYYWLIEWDVYCNGRWGVALEYYDTVSDADYMGTHIQIGVDDGWQDRWKPQVDYQWINSFKVGCLNKVKCFNPIARFSARALKCLCRCYNDGDYGFYETAMPTMLYNNGMILKNFDRYINNETIRFRPFFRSDFHMCSDCIYHPVKQKPINLSWLNLKMKTR